MRNRTLAALAPILIVLAAACGHAEPDAAQPIITAVPPTAAAQAAIDAIMPKLTAQPTSVPLPTPEAQPTVPAQSPAPAVVDGAIHIQTPTTWAKYVSPNGVLTAPTTTQMLTVRRWQGELTLETWTAYLPEAFAVKDSNVTLNLAGHEWQGIFIQCPDDVCKAFFARAYTGDMTYTLLVYVGRETDKDESIDTLWAQIAPAFNQALNTLSFADPDPAATAALEPASNGASELETTVAIHGPSEIPNGLPQPVTLRIEVTEGEEATVHVNPGEMMVAGAMSRALRAGEAPWIISGYLDPNLGEGEISYAVQGDRYPMPWQAGAGRKIQEAVIP